MIQVTSTDWYGTALLPCSSEQSARYLVKAKVVILPEQAMIHIYLNRLSV